MFWNSELEDAETEFQVASARAMSRSGTSSVLLSTIMYAFLVSLKKPSVFPRKGDIRSSRRCNQMKLANSEVSNASESMDLDDCATADHGFAGSSHLNIM